MIDQFEFGQRLGDELLAGRQRRQQTQRRWNVAVLATALIAVVGVAGVVATRSRSNTTDLTVLLAESGLDDEQLQELGEQCQKSLDDNAELTGQSRWDPASTQVIVFDQLAAGPVQLLLVGETEFTSCSSEGGSGGSYDPDQTIGPNSVVRESWTGSGVDKDRTVSRTAAAIGRVGSNIEIVEGETSNEALVEGQIKEGWFIIQAETPAGVAGAELPIHWHYKDGSLSPEHPGSHGACPVSLPPSPRWIPPEPWPSQPTGDDHAWFGTPDLWTVVSTGDYVERKSVWWSQNFPGGAEEPQPEIEVVYERLLRDQPGEIHPSPGTNAHTATDGWFMITGLEPNLPGCWQATATYKGATLTYVFEVL